jgi:hypothetical protein
LSAHRLGEFEKFTWKGRIVYLSFDSDLWINPQVRKALYELAVKLHLKGELLSSSPGIHQKARAERGLMV